MKIRILHQEDYLITPWKNGRGTTTQIAILPENASLLKGDFLWRVSTATISEDGMFSRFPGFKRYIAICEGEGIRLQFEDKEEFLSKGDFLEFSGDREVRCTRLGGNVRDLNLIFRKTLQARFEFSSETRTLQPQSGTTFIVFVSAGSVEVKYSRDSFHNLQLNETAVIEFNNLDDRDLAVIPKTGSTYALMQV